MNRKQRRDAHTENVIREIFGEENGQLGLEIADKMTDGQLVQVGKAVTAKLETAKELKPSSDLFKSNCYSLYDKTPEQIAVDAQAIKNRVQERAEKTFQKKLKNGTAITIDLHDKTSEEIDLMRKQMDFAAAKRVEKMRNSKILGTADSIAEVASLPGTYGKKAFNFVKQNPVKCIAGATGVFMLGKMLFGDDEKGGSSLFNFRNLMLTGLAVVVGGAYLFHSKPEAYNHLIESFGLDQLLNQAPAEHMFVAGVEEKRQALNSSVSKLAEETVGSLGLGGSVSAETAGGRTTSDLSLVEANEKTVQEWASKAQSIKTTQTKAATLS